ncbi:TolC family protein [Gelidibacter maritimus]|uniref:TolC family protein n=1 Tax=Gelidibacter maritimus TaxID=2761487 RepID=A0A7W2M580_9FLAO|nr:TolC family protein [Gelidibacter maritimus]MBA6152932.1 TolC family protein [Gelidibacter maritimus]
MKLKDDLTGGRKMLGFVQFISKVAVLIFIGISSSVFGQLSQTDTLKLSRQQYEEFFLKQNLLLLAETYKINQAEAMVLQAKLWPNPSLSIEEINLWTTNKQLSYLDEPLPQIFGNVAQNTQFAVQLEQQIITAGKRKKLMDVERVGVKVAEQEFEELLRNLKYEFRNTLTELQYLQLYTQVFFKQQDLINNLLNAYRRQLENDHISKGEYMRLQTLQLELSREINALSKTKNETEKELKVLLSITGPASLFVLEDDFTPDLHKLKSFDVLTLQQDFLNYRPDVKLAELENEHFKSLLTYEKSQAIPDFSLNASYDRGGGVWPSFFGFGLSIDLPIFNRNQGAIAYAHVGVENTSLLSDDIRLRAQAEFEQYFKDFRTSLLFYESIESEFEMDLDEIFESYTRNFMSRNIGLLQYLDFQEAYLENKKIILESKKELHLQFERLQHTIGKDI